MADLFYAGAYWGPRAESSAQCAARLEACLTSLGRSHDVLSRWYRKGTSRSAASGRPIDIDADTLESMLSGGRNRTDIGGEAIAELGFSLALWNNNPTAVSLSTLCGATPTTASIMNSFVLTLPAASGTAVELYDAEAAKRILMSMIEAWRPQWATFASHAMRARQNTVVPRPVVGWQTFVAASPQSPPPPGLQVENVDRGVLVTTGTDPLHVADAQFRSAIEYLRASGV
jgi:hypothetical protein